MERVIKMNSISNVKTNFAENDKLNEKINFSLLLIVLAAVLWGTSGVVAKHIMTMYEVSSLTIGALRLLIATPILLITSRVQIQEKIEINKKHYKYFVIYGLSIATYQITYFAAVKFSMVSIATLIALCTAPVFVAMLSKVFLAEKITSRVMVSLMISTIGTILVMGLTRNSPPENTQYLGYILALGAGLSFASFTICGKKLVKFYPPVSVVSIAFILGSLTMLPFLRIPSNIPLIGWAGLLYLGIVPTAFSYILFNIGLKKASATKASIATLCEPLTATALSLILIGERFTQIQGLGATLLITALLLIVIKK